MTATFFFFFSFPFFYFLLYFFCSIFPLTLLVKDVAGKQLLAHYRRTGQYPLSASKMGLHHFQDAQRSRIKRRRRLDQFSDLYVAIA